MKLLRNRHFYVLLMRLQNGRHLMEENLAISNKITYAFTFQSSSFLEVCTEDAPTQIKNNISRLFIVTLFVILKD